jgi:predicted RNA-binding Zn-ribbon protein involved in translation (DUF1610 family)
MRHTKMGTCSKCGDAGLLCFSTNTRIPLCHYCAKTAGTRTCVDCGVDIVKRGRVARRCERCARKEINRRSTARKLAKREKLRRERPQGTRGGNTQLQNVPDSAIEFCERRNGNG